MRKRIIAACLIFILLFSFAACGKTDIDATSDKTPSSTPQPTSIAELENKEPDEDKSGEIMDETADDPESDNQVDNNSPSKILEIIDDDFNVVTTFLTQKLEETFTAVGTTFEEYQENKSLISDWVELVISESDALFARTRDNSVEYFKLIANNPNHTDYEFCEEAFNKYYDAVYCDAMDKYYDKLYCEAMDSLYGKYYDGIIGDAVDSTDFNEWFDASTECFNTWYNASAIVYEKWYNEGSYFYGLRFAMYSAFCLENNFDVDAIITEFEAEISAGTDNSDEPPPSEEPEPSSKPESSEEPVPSEESETTTGIRAEFKSAMDSIEAFYDEYCGFMEEYMKNPTDLKLLTKYPEMLSKLSEMEKAFDAWENEDLNKEELAYYLEVTNRISQKLINIL